MAKPKILLVDDDEAVTTYLLAKLGARYELVATHDPAAVARFARELRPDLILCDVDMPEMDGGDVSAALFGDEELRHIPLLFLTALATPAEIARLQGQIGGRPAVSKSAPIEELAGRIALLLAG
jgi:CheY-like chemotaxis protein